MTTNETRAGSICCAFPLWHSLLHTPPIPSPLPAITCMCILMMCKIVPPVYTNYTSSSSSSSSSLLRNPMCFLSIATSCVY